MNRVRRAINYIYPVQLGFPRNIEDFTKSVLVRLAGSDFPRIEMTITRRKVLESYTPGG